MKKGIIKAGILMLLIVMMSGCSKNEGNAAGDGNSSGSAGSNKYVTLGEYKNLPVTVNSTTVTDEELEEAIHEALSSKMTTEKVTDRPVEEGDTVNIDYEGKKDGVPFDGGTAQGYDLNIGSGTFIPGFEDGLIGAKTGETRDLNLTFPEEYHSEELAGQDVVFTVKVNYIQKDVYPELTDELAKELNPDVSDAAGYKEKLKKNLEAEKERSAMSAAYADLLTQAKDNAKIASGSDLPKELIDENKKAQKESFERSLEMYGMDLNSYLQQQGMTEESFDETLTAYAETVAGEQLLVQALAEAENISVSEEDIEKQYEEDAATYGYANAAEFKEAVKAQGAEATFKEATLTRKVEEMLYSYADVKKE